MPSYDYHCPANGQTVEVFHPMSATIGTWGDLVRHAGMPAGATSVDAPVQRIIRGTFVATSSSASASKSQGTPCGSHCGCHPRQN